MSVVKCLLKGKGVCHTDIGVISPYAAQVQTIKQYLKADGYQTYQENESMDESLSKVIEVKTVDGYQVHPLIPLFHSRLVPHQTDV